MLCQQHHHAERTTTTSKQAPTVTLQITLPLLSYLSCQFPWWEQELFATLFLILPCINHVFFQHKLFCTLWHLQCLIQVSFQAQRASLAPNIASQQILTLRKYQHASLLPTLSTVLRQSLSDQPFSMLPPKPKLFLPVALSLQAQPGCLPLLASCHASEHCQSLQATIPEIFDLFISVLALNILLPFVCGAPKSQQLAFHLLLASRQSFCCGDQS